jgi:hypothetical protein
MSDEDYYRDRAQNCRNSANGYETLNPLLAHMYWIAATVWERLRFTSA